MFKLNFFKKTINSLSVRWPEVLFSGIISMLLTVGYILFTYQTIDITGLGKSLLVYVLGWLTTWFLVLFVLVGIKYLATQKQKTKKQISTKKISDRKFWLLTSLAIFVLYFPLILINQSVLTPDSWNSIGQVVGDSPLSSVHPIIFTAFLGFFVNIGLFFGSFQFGLVLFSIAQSVILALIFGYVILWMRNENLNRAFLIATFIFYAILPINAIAGIIMWKDILFAGFGLLLLILIRRLYVEKSAFFTKKNITYFLLIAFLFCVWRNNGIYTYILSIILIAGISYRVFLNPKYVALLVAPLLLVGIYSISSFFISKPTSQAEAMSVPLQQIARTVKYHGDTISSENKATIDEILPYEQLGKNYDPNLSDPVKSSFNVAVFNENKAKYLKLWFDLFLDYKKTYVAAFLYNTYGYTYPLRASPTTTDLVLDNASHLNAIKGYSDSGYESGGKEATSKYRDLIMSPMALLRNIGFYTVVLLVAAYIAVIRRRFELIGVFIVLFSLFLTTILGPVNGEFRYLYLFVIATPFVIGAAISNVNIRKGKE